jgi:transcriptional regulator with XRE-family HTH domain
MFEGYGGRVKAIREARGESQVRFAKALTELSGRYWEPTKVTRVETRDAAFTPEDVYDLARMDPEGRGMLWLGWGLDGDPTLRLPGPAPALHPAPSSDVTPSRQKPKAGNPGRRAGGAGPR